MDMNASLKHEVWTMKLHRRDIHWSATILKLPLHYANQCACTQRTSCAKVTNDICNTFIWPWQQFISADWGALLVNSLFHISMGKTKDLSYFDKGQIIMARWQGNNISETAMLLVGCSHYPMVTTYNSLKYHNKWYIEMSTRHGLTMPNWYQKSV